MYKPVGFVANTDYEARELSEIVTAVTHNHEKASGYIERLSCGL